jgi:hypothetical protein
VALSVDQRGAAIERLVCRLRGLFGGRPSMRSSRWAVVGNDRFSPPTGAELVDQPFRCARLFNGLTLGQQAPGLQCRATASHGGETEVGDHWV